jgi:hypothetical protein
MAPYIMLLMLPNTLQGQVGGGWAGDPGNQDIFSIELLGECHLGPKKVEISRAQPPLTCPSNGFGCIKSIMYRDGSIRGP